MISSIEGKVLEVASESVSLSVHGIGMHVYTPHPELYQAGMQATLVTYLHWNQEQGPSLFGFASKVEKELFLLIIGCSGIGPKIALTMLAQLSVADVIGAVQEGNVKVLSSVSGIGARKAEHIIVQLKNKVEKLIDSGDVALEGDSNLSDWKNLQQVFKSLNYSRQEIEMVLAHLRKTYGGTGSSFDELIRHGLSFLAKKV